MALQQAATADLVAQLAPVIAEVVSATADPFAQAAAFRARADRARRWGLTTRADILEAKAQAAERRTGLRLEAEQSTREWRALGKTGIIVGIVAGGAFILLLVSLARAANRH